MTSSGQFIHHIKLLHSLSIVHVMKNPYRTKIGERTNRKMEMDAHILKEKMDSGLTMKVAMRNLISYVNFEQLHVTSNIQ